MAREATPCDEIGAFLAGDNGSYLRGERQVDNATMAGYTLRIAARTYGLPSMSLSTLVGLHIEPPTMAMKKAKGPRTWNKIFSFGHVVGITVNR